MSLTDLMTRQEIMENYVDKDKELARELIEAGGDVGLMKRALIKKSNDDFIIDIFRDKDYEPFLLSVVDSAINTHPEVAQEIAQKKMGILQKKPVRKKKPIVKKTIRSRTKKGTPYKRSFKKWSSSEELFIRSRLRNDKSVSEIKKEFFDQTDHARTESSVSTKIYRIKGE